MKFGGTSMGSPQSLENVAKIIKKNLKHKPAIVVSAVSGVTDMLIDISTTALKSDKLLQSKFKKLEQKHYQIIDELFDKKSAEKTQLVKNLETKFTILKNYLTGINLIKELSPHSEDFISSYGERLSTLILSHYLRSIGIKSDFVMGDEYLVTTCCPGGGDPLISASRKKGRAKIEGMIKKGFVPVITGFFGRSTDGHITTLGRGGSDYSASIVGAIINAKEVQIWTDVSGIYTTDPRICSHAKPHKIISFREASEMARFGAKVIHPRTMLPAIENQIPVFIKNTFHPENQGTEISFDEKRVPNDIKAITIKKGVTLITVETAEMLMTYGFMAKVTAIFDKHNVPMDVIATSEISISTSIETSNVKPIVKDLQKLGDVTVDENLCIICVVGQGLKSNLKTNAKILDALSTLNLEAKVISQGAPQNNFTLVIPESAAIKAVNKIHDTLFKK